MLIKSKALSNGSQVDLTLDTETNRYALSVDDYWCSGYNLTRDEAEQWLNTITRREIVDMVTDACAVGEH